MITQFEINKLNNQDLNSYYELAYNFVKEDAGKTVKLDYNDKVLLLALNKQVLCGPFTEEKSDPIGFFDYLGHDIKNQWNALASIGLEDSQRKYIELTSKKSEKLVKIIQESITHKHDIPAVTNSLIYSEFAESEMAAIKESLKESTMKQYKDYAIQVFPNDGEKQSQLIEKLQTQHFEQLMEAKLTEKMENRANSKDLLKSEISTSSCQNEDLSTSKCQPEDLEKSLEIELDKPEIWFKDKKSEFVASPEPKQITILAGNSVTIRFHVPDNAQFIKWSFATVKYDIHFGVYFAHFELAEFPEEEGTSKSAFEVVPIGSCRSNEFIVCGQHRVFGQKLQKPNYLLVFDNSYSFWNPKTIRFVVEFS